MPRLYVFYGYRQNNLVIEKHKNKKKFLQFKNNVLLLQCELLTECLT